MFHKYGFMVLCQFGRAVKTTVEVSDDLYRRAKSEAALRGRKLKDLVEEGLRLVLFRPSATRTSSAKLQECPCWLVWIEQIHGEIFAFDIAQFLETLVECDPRGPRSDSRAPVRSLRGYCARAAKGPRHGSAAEEPNEVPLPNRFLPMAA